MIEKSYLLDVFTKLYIATDSNPVDGHTYELCSGGCRPKIYIFQMLLFYTIVFDHLKVTNIIMCSRLN